MTEYKDPASWGPKHVQELTSVFNPTGIVPWNCRHGEPLAPEGVFVHRTPWLDPKTGRERPPWACNSWGRAKDIKVTAFGSMGGALDGVPYARIQCPTCRGE